MKRSPLALLALAVALSPAAFAAEHDGWVYNGLTGAASFEEGGVDDTAFGSSSAFGYRWGEFGVDVGYTGFGTFEDKLSSATGSVKLEADVGGWTAGITANANLNDSWSIQGRLGAYGWNADGEVKSGTTRVAFDDDGVDWYAGVSLDYNWSWNQKWAKRASIGLGVTNYRLGGDVGTNIMLVGLHSEFRF